MAIRSDGVWEVRPSGDQNNGSVFSSALGGTDFTQQDSAALTITDGASVGPGTTLTSATGGFLATHVGNGIGIVHGGTYQGVWQILTYVSTNEVTVDRNLPATSSMTCRVGGANKFANNAIIFINQLVAGNKIWVKGPGASGGDYSISTSSLSLSVSGSNVNPITMEGYTTTRGDGGRPSIKWSSGAINCLTVSGDFNIVKNLTLDASTGATDALLVTGAVNYFENVECKNQAPAVVSAGGNFFKRCRFTDSNNNDHGVTVSGAHCVFRECMFDANTGSGVDVDEITHFQSCIFHGNTLDGISYADAADDFGFTVQNCNIWNNGRDGLRISSTSADGILKGVVVHRCIFGKHASGYDINYTTSDISANTGAIQWANALLDCNAYYTTGSGKMNNLPACSGDITLSASPFTSDTNFTLNSTAGAGATLRATHCDDDWPDGINSGSYQIGALGAPGADSSITSAINRWRELTNESSTTAVTDATISSFYIQPALEATNRRLQYHYTTDNNTIEFIEGQQEYSAPNDLVEIAFIELGGKLLQKRDMEDWQRMNEDWRNEENGTPIEWAHYANQIIFRPAPSGACVASTPNPTLRYVSRPVDFTTNGMAQLDECHRDIPILLAAGEYLMTPSSAMDLGYGKALLERYEQECQLAAKVYQARRVAQ